MKQVSQLFYSQVKSLSSALGLNSRCVRRTEAVHLCNSTGHVGLAFVCCYEWDGKLRQNEADSKQTAHSFSGNRICFIDTRCDVSMQKCVSISVILFYLSQNVIVASIAFNFLSIRPFFVGLFSYFKQKQTPWYESASELYRPSDRRLSAK
jgi:hypothetical protein